MTLRKGKRTLLQHIITPVVGNITGALCMTCGRVVDSEELVEGYPGDEDADGNITKPAGSDYFVILVRHHGAEEICRFEQEGRLWGPTDIKKAMQRKNWFDPFSGHLGK